MRATHACLGIAAFAFCIARAAAAAEFTGAFVFGDDFSDGGQYGSRFTTNPGLTTPMYLAGIYALPATPSMFGGTNYAAGGVRVSQPSPFVPAGEPQRPVATQISELINARPLDVNAMYIVQGGSNDILALNQAAAIGQLNPAQLNAEVVRAANDLAAQVLRLWSAGARHFVVFALPDLGKTPLAAEMSAQSTLSGLSALFNSTLDAALAAYAIDIVSVNTSALLTEIMANPSIYGFQNATTPACTSVVNGKISSLACTPATLRQPNAAETYVFADDVNFTTRTNRIMAQYAASIIAAPEQIVLLGEAPLQVANAQLRVYDGRMRPAQMRQRGGVETFGAIDFGNSAIGATPNSPAVSSDIASLAVGVDTTVGANSVAGMFFGYSGSRASFGDSRGGFRLNESLLTGYVVTQHEPWYVGIALFTGLNLDFKNVQRNIELGDTTRSERGDTTGTHIGGRVNAGWDFVAGDWTHGPIASLGYQRVIVKAYAEHGSTSTTMQFGHQKRESTLATIGWQVSAKLNIAGMRVTPWALLQGDFEQHRPHDRVVEAGLTTATTTFNGAAFHPRANRGELDAGASAEFSRSVTGFVTAGAIPDKNNRSYGATVGLKVAI